MNVETKRAGFGVLVLLVSILLGQPVSPMAMELCSPEARDLMHSVGIEDAKIAALCDRFARTSARLMLDLVRTEDTLGYCRVTLRLDNNSTLPVNAMVLTATAGRFEPFTFRSVAPGGTGYASANSRILLACDELPEVKLTLHWPISLRVDGRPSTGRQLQYYRPHFLDTRLAWSR